MRKFIGSSRHKLDAKGRVSLPAQFRKVIAEMGGAEIIVLPNLRARGSLECFTMAGFDAFLDSIAGGLDAGEDSEMMHLVAGEARELAIDDTGRVVLPADLRDAASLETGGEVQFVAALATFQIWSPANAEAYKANRLDEKRARLARARWFDFHKPPAPSSGEDA